MTPSPDAVDAAAVVDAALHEFELLFDTAPLSSIVAAAEILEWASKGRPHQVYATGVGKSGIAAQKFAATLAAHGVPSQFIDPVEAQHGGIGRITSDDRVVAFSVSGNTAELRDFVTALRGVRRGGEPVIDVGVYGQAGALARDTLESVILGVTDDHDRVTRFVPSMTFLVQCVIGDALALLVAKHNAAPGPAATHVGGNLGQTRPWD